MLSILIPIYNQSVVSLVEELNRQCNELDIEHQILCFDDGSTEKIKESNQVLASMMCVNYLEMSENKGRAKIRNAMAKLARYDWLLFLDGDSTVKTNDFISKYMTCIGEGRSCVYGGRIYDPQKPEKKHLLHWQYGRKREALNVKVRTQNPWLNFQSNNFLIQAKLFLSHLFDEQISGYGYEDLVFSNSLEKAKIPIHHIDNPVQHDGLEHNEAFIMKTDRSLENLAKLYASHQLSNTRLTKTFEQLCHFFKPTFIGKYESYSKKLLERSIEKSRPSLLYFSLWKLCKFSNIMSKVENTHNKW